MTTARIEILTVIMTMYLVLREESLRFLLVVVLVNSGSSVTDLDLGMPGLVALDSRTRGPRRM